MTPQNRQIAELANLQRRAVWANRRERDYEHDTYKATDAGRQRKEARKHKARERQ